MTYSPFTNRQQVPREGTNHRQPHQAILLHSQRGPGHSRNSQPLQHQVASNLHLKTSTSFQRAKKPIIFQHLGLELFELCGNQKFVWKWMLMHILYYMKYKHFYTVYVCNFCLLRESIQPKSSKSFFSPKLPKWLQLVTQAAAPWTFEGWQNFPHLWQVLEDVHSTTQLSHTGGCSTNLT